MLTLYHHGSSVCAAKVRLAMNEKRIRWTGRYVDILKGEQFDDDFQKLNPKSLVPVLVHDDHVIVESTLICEYLEDQFPENPIYPRTAFPRMKARRWAKIVDEELHPACAAVTFILSHRHTLFKLGPEKLEEFLSSTPVVSLTPTWKEDKRRYVEQGFEAPGAAEMVRLYDHYLHVMDEVLADGEWLVGDAFSIADISMVPYVNRLDMLGLSRLWTGGRRARVERWWRSVRERPAFRTEVLDWIPTDLADDLRNFGPRGWPQVSSIVGLS